MRFLRKRILEISAAIFSVNLHSLHFFSFFFLTFTDIPVVNVLQHTMATLPCPQRHTNVSWTRFRNGKPITLASIKNGGDVIPDKHFALQADNSLVIMKVLPSDSGMYLCSSSRIYLNVTTDPKSVGSTLGPNQKNVGEESGDQTSPDIWKTAAGVTVGAALALLSVVTLILCLKRRSQKQSVAEVIYEEVKHVEGEPSLENPYVYISETADASTPTAGVLYCKVSRQRAGGSSGEECVYSLAQLSPQTGSLASAPHHHAV